MFNKEVPCSAAAFSAASFSAAAFLAAFLFSAGESFFFLGVGESAAPPGAGERPLRLRAGEGVWALSSPGPGGEGERSAR